MALTQVPVSMVDFSVNPTLSGGTANGVAYLNGSKVVTTGSALTFDGAGIFTVASAVAQMNLTPSTTTNNALYRATNAGGTAFIGLDSSAGSLGAAYGLSLYHTGNYPIVFSTNGSEQMRLTSTGLGIGTSSPAAKLDVLGSSGDQIRVRTAGTEFYRFGRNSGTGFLDFYGSQTGYQGYTFGGVDGTWMTINSSGNLGIGTSSPSTKLEVSVADAATATRWIAATGRLRLRPYVDATNGAVFESTNTAESSYLPLSLFGSSVRLGNGAQVIIDSSGNLGLGVTPSAWSGLKAFEIAGVGSSLASASNNNLFLSSNAWYNGTNWRYGTSAEATQYQSFAGAHKWYNAPSGTAGNAITFTQAMTLDASGNLGIGTTSPSARLNVSGGDLFVERSDYPIVSLYRGTTRQGYLWSVAGSYFELVADSRPLFLSAGGANYVATYTNGSERARIDSSGNLLIGTTSSDGSRLRVYGSYQTLGDGSYEGLIGKASSLVSGGGTGEFAIRSSSNLLFATNGNTERARIDTSGNFLIGTTTAGAGIGWSPKLTVDASGTFGPLFKTNSAGFEALDLWNSATSGTRYQVYFRDGTGGARGSITTDGANTAFNTSSDYRLKDNPQPLTGSGAFIDALKPKTWVWKETGVQGVGFIAHEVQEVSPGSVVGEKDGEKMQQMEYGSAEFIANIIAELQSLRARVAQLETK